MVNDLTFAPAPTMLESLHAAVAEQNSAISLIKKHEDDFGVGRSSGLADGAHLLSAACAAVAALCKASSTIERLMTIEADTDDARRVEVKKKKEKSSGESLSRRTSGKRVSGTFGRASGTFGGSADDGTEDEEEEDPDNQAVDKWAGTHRLLLPAALHLLATHEVGLYMSMNPIDPEA